MKNFEKFKTLNERDSAFRKFCGKRECESCDLDVSDKFWCTFAWLELEAEEDEILPCPFCGGKTYVVPHEFGRPYSVKCRNDWCCYHSGKHPTRDGAIAAHNRVAKAVMASKERETKHD